ncbi:group II intron maturase-specific domain-containing protein [Lentilactobacillus kisonensis]
MIQKSSRKMLLAKRMRQVNFIQRGWTKYHHNRNSRRSHNLVSQVL